MKAKRSVKFQRRKRRLCRCGAKWDPLNADARPLRGRAARWLAGRRSSLELEHKKDAEADKDGRDGHRGIKALHGGCSGVEVGYEDNPPGEDPDPRQVVGR